MRLLRFVEDWIRHLGGEAERYGPQVTLLAPPGLGVPELMTFHEGDTSRESLFLGHPYLEAALTETRQGEVVAIRHRPPGLPKTDLAARAAKSLACRNAHLKVMDSPLQRVIPWAFFHYRVSYLWDDKREELRNIGVDLATLAEVSPQRLERVWLEPGPLEADREQLTAAEERGRLYLQRLTAPRAQTLQNEAQRYLEVERSRLEGYYQMILQDLSRRSNAQEKTERALAERELRRRDLEENREQRSHEPGPHVDLQPGVAGF